MTAFIARPDTNNDSSETANLELRNPRPGLQLGEPSTGNITITDYTTDSLPIGRNAQAPARGLFYARIT